MPEIVGFRVTIGTADGSVVEDDYDWTSFQGGGGSIPICSPSILECLPRTPSLDVFTLRGPLTSGRKALCEWINKTMESAGAPEVSRRDVRITELVSDGGAVQEGRSLSYRDCELVEYRFPRLDAGGSCELLEEVRIKPIRLDLA
jgi:hypothetical protein